VHRCDESSGAWASRLATSTISCKTRRGVHVTGWFHMCKHYDHTRVVGSFVGNRRHETHSSITLWLRCDKIINPQPGSKRAQNMQKSSQDLLFYRWKCISHGSLGKHVWGTGINPHGQQSSHQLFNFMPCVVS